MGTSGKQRPPSSPSQSAKLLLGRALALLHLFYPERQPKGNHLGWHDGTGKAVGARGQERPAEDGGSGPGGQPGPLWSSCTSSPLPEARPWRDCPGTCQVEAGSGLPAPQRQQRWAWKGWTAPEPLFLLFPPLLLPPSLLLLFLLFLTPNRELHARAVTWKCQLLPKAGDWLHRTPLSLKGLCLVMAVPGWGRAGVSQELGTFLPPAGARACLLLGCVGKDSGAGQVGFKSSRATCQLGSPGFLGFPVLIHNTKVYCPPGLCQTLSWALR